MERIAIARTDPRYYRAIVPCRARRRYSARLNQRIRIRRALLGSGSDSAHVIAGHSSHRAYPHDAAARCSASSSARCAGSSPSRCGSEMAARRAALTCDSAARGTTGGMASTSTTLCCRRRDEELERYLTRILAYSGRAQGAAAELIGRTRDRGNRRRGGAIRRAAAGPAPPHRIPSRAEPRPRGLALVAIGSPCFERRPSYRSAMAAS